jgi:glycosyltransferase involved in cell wall biosynthesis
MSLPLVSVVTPVYNGERHLEECLESVLAQRYPHWDHVVVDNASGDRSVEIARRYAAKDPRIRVVARTEHLDVIGSHNAAFRELSPRSRYCKPLQADDWLFPDCLGAMVELAEAYPDVGIVGAYRLDGEWVDLDGVPWTSPVIPGRAMGRLGLLGGPYVFGAPTATLIRSDIVRARDPFYDPACIHADEAACYEVLQHADFGFVHQVLTYRRRHDEDATMSSFARRVNTYLPGSLWILQRYGPVFLAPEEYRQRLAERFAQYDAFLGEALLRRRDREFWAYHRQALDALGRPLGRRRLAVSAFRRAARLPLRALRRVLAPRAVGPGGDAVQARVAHARRHAAAKRAEIERASPLVAAMLVPPAPGDGRGVHTGVSA